MAPSSPSARRSTLMDLGLGAWALAWLVVGVLTGIEIWRLGDVGSALVESGEALDEAGIALEALGRVPVIGERPGELGAELRQAAGEVTTSGATARESLRTVGPLIGVAIALVPSVPVLAVYVPRRRAELAAVASTRRLIEDPTVDEAVEEHLARRALQHLSFEELRSLSPNPWRDVDAGRYRLLANAELTRLGLARPGGIRGGGGQDRPARTDERERSRDRAPGAGD